MILIDCFELLFCHPSYQRYFLIFALILDSFLNQSINQTAWFKPSINHISWINRAFDMGSKVDPIRSRFPFCVVWTPIPFLSWVLLSIVVFNLALFSINHSSLFYSSQVDISFCRTCRHWHIQWSHSWFCGLIFCVCMCGKSLSIFV